MRIEITEEASQSLNEIIEFLYVFWSEREIEVMLLDLDNALDNIEIELVSYPFFHKKIQYFLIGNNHVKTFFEVQQNLIRVLYFHHEKQNPTNLDFLKK